MTHAPLIAVTRHRDIRGVKLPGAVHKATGERHTYDWREEPGSPANTFRVKPLFAVMPLRKALDRHYRTDAHLVPYIVHAPDGTPLRRQPRLTKDALVWVLDQGYRVLTSVLFVDVDNPSHIRWNRFLRHRFDKLWGDPPEVLRTAGTYGTKHGYRIFQALREPVSVLEVERHTAAWFDMLEDAGVGGLDRSCSDWTRLYRLPFVQREVA